MDIPNTYKALDQQHYSFGAYSIVPIRFEDRHAIMKWRNEQMYHLRQAHPLTVEAQDKYFDEVVKSLFDMEYPNQLLFSFLEEDKCIGYGGLVHINWVDKNAEISFLMDTILDKDKFKHMWQYFLVLIERVAFDKNLLHKIYTYAFDVRPKLYEVLKSSDYTNEAELMDHCYINGEYKKVVIHSKINKQ